MADAGVGDQAQQAGKKTQAGAQHGDEGDGLVDELGSRALDGRLHDRAARADRAHGLVAHQRADLLHHEAELLGPRVLVAQAGELLLDEGVVADDEFGCHID